MKYILALVLLTSNSIYSQNLNKEFEGVITYKTTIVLAKEGFNIDSLYREFGKESLYFFKAGKFKWVPQNSNLEYEIFNPQISRSNSIYKLHSSDTLFYMDLNKSTDTITSVKKSKKMTIINIPCNSAIFTVTDEKIPGFKMFRTIYYPTDSLQYANAYFDNHKANGQGFIDRYTRSIPLRMELSGKGLPILIIYEAASIQWKKLADSEFLVDEKLPVKK
jgi:hypothetical protein